jgi:hypothetical protein
MKIDRDISYGMARKIFEEKIQASKKTYAEIAGKYIDDLAKDEAMNCKLLRQARKKAEHRKNPSRGGRAEQQIKSHHRKTDKNQGRKCKIKATDRKYAI